MWLGAMFASMMPFAWLPVVATGGLVIGKRLGGRRGLQKIAQSFPEEPKLLDYSPVMEVIASKDLEAKTAEYYGLKIMGTRKEKLKRIFRPDPEVKLLKKDLTEGFGTLVEKSREMFMDAPEDDEKLYAAISQTYNYVHRGFKGKFFKKKGFLLFGI